MASEIIERKMYKGEVHLIHNPDAKGSAPRYKIMEGDKIIAKPKGVTTILGQTLAKDLISWAVGMAQDYLREKLPVITEQDLEQAGRAYMVRRDAGASTGTEAHAMVENYLKGLTQTSGSKEATNAYHAFVEWFESETPTVINVEEVIYSKEHEFAGTYDCMLEIDGKVVLCDLKTTNTSKKAPQGIYAENFIQLGAYAMAHEEQRKYEGEDSKLREIDDLMVISAKKDGKLDIMSASTLGLSVKECGEMFKRVVNIYHFLAQVSKQMGG